MSSFVLFSILRNLFYLTSASNGGVLKGGLQEGDTTLVAGPSSLYLLYNQCIKLIS